MKLYGFCIDERKIYFVFRPTLDHQQVTYQLLTYLTSSRLPHQEHGFLTEAQRGHTTQYGH